MKQWVKIFTHRFVALKLRETVGKVFVCCMNLWGDHWLRHFVVVVDYSRQRVLCRWHYFGWSVRRCQRSRWRRWRWIRIGEEDSFEWYSVDFQLDNQLRLARRWVFCKDMNRRWRKLFKFTPRHGRLTFTDYFELHSVEHSHSKILQSVLLFVMRRRRLMMVTSVLSARRLWSVLNGNFPRRHGSVVVADVMMVVVDGTLAGDVAVGSH